MATKLDLHTVLVDAASDRTDVLDDVTKTAETFDASAAIKEAVAEGGDVGDNLVHILTRSAIVASMLHLGRQQDVIAAQVVAEGEAIKRQDPSKVGAITDKQIADRKVAKAQEKK